MAEYVRPLVALALSGALAGLTAALLVLGIGAIHDHLHPTPQERPCP